MSDTCDVCGRGAPTRQATMMKPDGGGHIAVCDDCRDRLETPRCRVCGDTVTRDDPPRIHFGGGPGGTEYVVCRSCRRGIRFDSPPVDGDTKGEGEEERYRRVLRRRRQEGECDCCGATENLNAEVVHGDVETARIDWVCDGCREKGRGLK